MVARETRDVSVVAQLLTLAGNDIGQADVVAALASASDDLTQLPSTGTTFSLKHNSDLYTVLRKLHGNGYLKLSKRKDTLTVEVQ